jgi:hypothetical protein
VSVRAQWHLADLAVDQDDGSDPMADLLNMAKPIDLSEDRASLNARLQSLIQQEARIAEATGVECDIKYDAGHSCLTCPQFTADPDDRMFSVCRIGREQFTVLATLEAHKELEELEVLALQRMLEDECDELAEALLPV